MDLENALREGPNFVRNAEDALKRAITNPEMLYVWDNQVAAIDGYLANSEPFTRKSEELVTLREQLRGYKKELEQKVTAFEAEQEGEEPPEDPPEAEVIDEFKEMAVQLYELAEGALQNEVTDVKGLVTYEDPRDLINGFLADSEPFKEKDEDLHNARRHVRRLKVELDKRIRTIEEDWRAADLAAGR